MSDVTLSENAAKRINAILAKQSGKDYLRVSVEGGGCSGFSYKYDLTDEALAARLGKAGRDAVTTRFTAEQMAQRVATICADSVAAASERA